MQKARPHPASGHLMASQARHELISPYETFASRNVVPREKGGPLGERALPTKSGRRTVWNGLRGAKRPVKTVSSGFVRFSRGLNFKSDKDLAEVHAVTRFPSPSSRPRSLPSQSRLGGAAGEASRRDQPAVPMQTEIDT